MRSGSRGLSIVVRGSPRHIRHERVNTHRRGTRLRAMLVIAGGLVVGLWWAIGPLLAPWCNTFTRLRREKGELFCCSFLGRCDSSCWFSHGRLSMIKLFGGWCCGRGERASQKPWLPNFLGGMRSRQVCFLSRMRTNRVLHKAFPPGSNELPGMRVPWPACWAQVGEKLNHDFQIAGHMGHSRGAHL